MTHADLVKRAVRWLASSRRCVVVLAESSAFCSNQVPDALGWTSPASRSSLNARRA